jgi:hypothetical protein
LKIEGTFLQSRVARRIVTLFVLCALVPTFATALLSYNRVHDLLLEQGYRQLAQMNEAYATALYDRLLAANVQLRERPSNFEAGSLQWSAEFTQHLKTARLACHRPSRWLAQDAARFPAAPAGADRGRA